MTYYQVKLFSESNTRDDAVTVDAVIHVTGDAPDTPEEAVRVARISAEEVYPGYEWHVHSIERMPDKPPSARERAKAIADALNERNENDTH